MSSKNPLLPGYFNSGGHPALKVSVFGIHDSLKKEFEVMIDTGFTGFMLMPIMSAFPLGLTLLGTGNYTLADNSTSPKLLAIGQIVVANEDPVQGVIVLEPNECTVLLGMDFLRKAKRCLSVSVKGVVLTDEDTVDKILDMLTKAATAATAATASVGTVESQTIAPPQTT
jgi:predicted aspartyl protease